MDFWSQFWATLIGAVVGAGIGAGALFMVYRFERGEREKEHKAHVAEVAAEAERRRDERLVGGLSTFLVELTRLTDALIVMHGWDRVTMPPPADARVGPTSAALNVAYLSANEAEAPVFESIGQILWASERSVYSDAMSYTIWTATYVTEWRTRKRSLESTIAELKTLESRAVDNCNQACVW